MDQTKPPGTRKFAFLLLEKFTLLAFSSAIEPLRLTNLIAGEKLYDWQVISENDTVGCSGGMQLTADAGLIELDRDTTVIIVGGADIKNTTSKPVLNWLRRESRRGLIMGAVCTGPYVLAQAGLLDGKRVTIHWENYDSFAEEFPEIDLTQNLFIIDGNRITSSGGTAPSDLMLRIIATDHGSDIANAVADQMIHTSIRSERDEQRLSIPTRIGVRHPKLSTVIQMMEANIEDPISPSVLASDVAMSTRQLERLFRRYVNRSPKRYYMELRLNRARNLLMQTNMSVINVALACGFSSPSHFSKCYRNHFGTTPYRERGSNPTPV